MSDGVTPTLSDRLQQAAKEAQLTHAGWRPRVAEHLFEHGLLPTAEALAGSPARDPILELLWTLQMQTVGSRDFGVSTPNWRKNPAYPDRYFPVVWLDLVPQLIGEVDEGQRRQLIVDLFNLGENLVRATRSLAGRVADYLLEHAADIPTRGLEGVVQDALATAGVLGGQGTQGDWTHLAPTQYIPTAIFQDDLVPAGLSFRDFSIVIQDATRPFALMLQGTGDGTQLVDRLSPGAPAQVVRPPITEVVKDGKLTVSDQGEVVWSPQGETDVPLGRLDLRGLYSIAIAPTGRIAVSRLFSQRVEVRDPIP